MQNEHTLMTEKSSQNINNFAFTNFISFLFSYMGIIGKGGVPQNGIE